MAYCSKLIRHPIMFSLVDPNSVDPDRESNDTSQTMEWRCTSLTCNRTFFATVIVRRLGTGRCPDPKHNTDGFMSPIAIHPDNQCLVDPLRFIALSPIDDREALLAALAAAPEAASRSVDFLRAQLKVIMHDRSNARGCAFQNAVMECVSNV